jgi:hypothetical protein
MQDERADFMMTLLVALENLCDYPPLKVLSSEI